MNIDALHKLQEAGAIIRSIEARLYRLADAFEATGNHGAAEKLCRLADDASRANKLVDAGTSEALNNSLTASEQATANMLMATLAVANRSALSPPLAHGEASEVVTARSADEANSVVEVKQ